MPGPGPSTYPSSRGPRCSTSTPGGRGRLWRRTRSAARSRTAPLPWTDPPARHRPSTTPWPRGATSPAAPEPHPPRSDTGVPCVSVDTPRWAREAVFYQIFPDRFAASDRVPKPGPMEAWDAPPTVHGYKGGDLLGIVERLDDLVDLGISALYLTPILTSASNHRYHTDDYLQVDPLLGGDAALRELLDEAHARDMRVVLDGVFNHTGRGFWAFHHVLENGGQSPYRDWFHWHPDALDGRHPIRPYPFATDV